MKDDREHKAFEILAREHSRMLFAYLSSIVMDPAAVDDLFQETLVVAWKKLGDCDLSRPFGPWLRGIASRQAMAYHRKRKQGPIVLDDVILNLVEHQFHAIENVPSDSWEDKVSALRDCIDALPEGHQVAISGRYFDGLKAPRLSERLGISVEACWKRLARGRALLSECLTRKGVIADLEASS